MFFSLNISFQRNRVGLILSKLLCSTCGKLDETEEKITGYLTVWALQSNSVFFNSISNKQNVKFIGRMESSIDQHLENAHNSSSQIFIYHLKKNNIITTLPYCVFRVCCLRNLVWDYGCT